jgi:SPP1 gp7 family putative phage head morphogenesis protein
MLVPAGEASAPAAQPQNDPGLAEPDAVKAALAAIRKRKHPTSNAHVCTCSLDDDAMDKARDPKEVKLWKSIVAKRRESIRAYISAFGRVLMMARREVLQKLENAPEINPKSVTRAAAADFLFNLANFDKAFQVAMRGVSVDALQKAGEQVFAELGKDDPWSMPQKETIEFLQDRKNKLSNVPQDVFDRIKGRIEAGINGGDSNKTIADAVRAEFNDIGEGRAKVIANTETAAAYGTGRHEAMTAAGVAWKRWLTSGNANVRPAHQDMNGIIVAIDEPFVVIEPKTGESDEVQHPAESDGEPWNVINCHCVEIASPKGPEGEVEPSA